MKLITFFARLTDYFILYSIGVSASLFSSTYIDPLMYGAFALLLPILWAPLEALCISRWHTTLGHSLFGLKVEGLTYYEALKRALFFKISDSMPQQLQEKPKGKLGLRLAAAALILFSGAASPWIKEYYSGPLVERSVEGWLRFSPAEKNFKVHFPSEPIRQEKELNLSIARKVVSYPEFICHVEDQIAYAVSYVQLPSKFRLYGSSTVLKAAFNLIPENGPVAKEVKQDLGLHHQKYPALNFSLLLEDQRIQGRLILIDGMLFKLTVALPSLLEKETQAFDFFDSFRAK